MGSLFPWEGKLMKTNTFHETPSGILSRLVRSGLSGLLLWSFFILSSQAWAAPVSYSVANGTVDLSVSVGGVIIGSQSTPLTNGAFTIDDAAQSLDDFEITLEPYIVMSLSAAYGGYDTVTIQSATLSSDSGFVSQTVGSTGSTYTVLGSPLSVSGLWGGSNSGGPQPTVTDQPITYAVPSMTAIIGGSPVLFINSVTLNSLDGTPFGESAPLVVIASINVDSATVVPEPTTALLLGLGLLGLSAKQRRTRRSL